MTHHWDELSKSLAEESLPRRESLRRLGAVLAGAVLSPLGMGTAFAGKQDPCKTFCKCRNKRQQDQCLTVCKACNKNTSRLAGTCGGYSCCASGQTSCGSYCTTLASDVYNCGACGHVCDQPGPYEYGACVNGGCEYACVDGASRCNGTCTYVAWDANNCGACGNVCGGSTPYCNQGACSPCWPGGALCDGQCVDLTWNASHCGACGNVCGGSTPYCSGGQCTDCEGAGGAICGGACTDILWDALNCGACGNQCAPLDFCSFGVCSGVCIGCE